MHDFKIYLIIPPIIMNGNREQNALNGAYGSTWGLLKYAPEESVTITFERRK